MAEWLPCSSGSSDSVLGDNGKRRIENFNRHCAPNGGRILHEFSWLGLEFKPDGNALSNFGLVVESPILSISIPSPQENQSLQNVIRPPTDLPMEDQHLSLHRASVYLPDMCGHFCLDALRDQHREVENPIWPIWYPCLDPSDALDFHCHLWGIQGYTLGHNASTSASWGKRLVC